MAIRGKRGIMFTLISVLMSMLFIFMFMPYSDVPSDDKIIAVNTRVTSTDSFVQTYDAFIKNSMEVSGKLAFDVSALYRRQYNGALPSPTSAEFFPDTDLFACDYTSLLMDGNVTLWPQEVVPGAAFPATDMNSISTGEDVGQQWVIDKNVLYILPFRVMETQQLDKLGFYILRSPQERGFLLNIYQGGCDKPLFKITSVNATIPKTVGTGTAFVQINLSNNPILRKDQMYYFTFYRDDAASTPLVLSKAANPNVLYPYGKPNKTAPYNHPFILNFLSARNMYLNALLANVSNFSEEKMKLDVDYTVFNVSFYQSDPWTIQLQIDMDYRINDSYSTWHVTGIQEVPLDIAGMIDPLRFNNLLVTNYHQMPRMQRSSEITGVWDVRGSKTALLDMVNNGYYITSNRAPSYLMRFLGDNTPSDLGLEFIWKNVGPVKSFVDGFFYNNSPTINPNISSVDFLIGNRTFFDCPSGQVLKYPGGAVPSFQLDFQSAIYYNATDWMVPACIFQTDCGDGIMDYGEECDKLDFGLAHCPAGGYLVCTSNCKIDRSHCTIPGGGSAT